MRKFNFLLILLFVLNIKNCLAQNIYYADLDSIIKNSDIGKKIITYFDNENSSLLDEIKKFQTQIKDKEKKIISQKNILETNEYVKKVNFLQSEIDNFNKKNNEKIQKLNNNKDKTLNLLMIEINKILKEFAETNNIDIILSSKQMLIGKSSLDMTDKILKTVNKNVTKIEIIK